VLVDAKGLKRISLLLSGLVFLNALVVLAGWLLHLPVLTTFLPGLVAMKANTAIGLLLAAIALALLQTEEHGARRTIGKICAAVVATIGVLTASEFIFGINLGIDDLVAAAPPTDPNNPFPSRMSPISAVGLVLTGFALVLLDVRAQVWVNPSEILAASALLASLVGIVGHLYSAQALYRVGVYSSMALHTAAAFVMLV
jgi:hypothetical protein